MSITKNLKVEKEKYKRKRNRLLSILDFQDRKWTTRNIIENLTLFILLLSYLFIFTTKLYDFFTQAYFTI
jgi:hypothetical protein